jgi:membrane protein
MTQAGELPTGATPPQPERQEPRVGDPRLRDLSFRDWRAILVRGGRQALADHVTDIAASLAYYAFLAIPAVLLVAVGVFSQTAGPETIESMLDRLEGVVPAEALTLIDDSLTRITENQSSGVALIVVGFLLALWTASSAMNALIRGLNRVYDREETRSIVKQRLTALGILACLFVAFGLVFVLLVLGPLLSEWVGDALELEGLLSWLWWILEWPILVLGLLAAFAAVLYLGPNIAHQRLRFLTPGAVAAVVIWLGASGVFAFYVSSFGSYNKAWGSLAAVIIMLTWLWLSALALLLGAELNAEAERSRELRQGKPAEVDLQAPTRG